jgi:hypothetical protein
VQSRIDQTLPENHISTFEPGFETATQKFRNQLSRHMAGAADVESVLRQASLINGFMAGNRLGRQIQNDWATVKIHLQELANAYGISWDWNRQVPSFPNSSGSFQLSDGDINDLIQRLETGGDTFRTSLTEAFWESPYDRTMSEGHMNDAVRGLKNETNQLRNLFDNKQPIVSSVERMLARAAPIDTYLHRNVLTSRVQNDWSSLRGDINKLAGAYNLSEIGRK